MGLTWLAWVTDQVHVAKIRYLCAGFGTHIQDTGALQIGPM
jgi:hypothetical protein